MNAQIEKNVGGHQYGVLAGALDSPVTSLEAIAYCEELIKAICSFNTRLLGEGGARAVLARAISLAASEAPLVQKILPTSEGGDFTELRKYVEAEETDVLDLYDSFVYLGEKIFFTLSDLTGDLMTVPLLKHLQKRE